MPSRACTSIFTVAVVPIAVVTSSPFVRARGRA